MSQIATMLNQSKKTSHFCIDALWAISKFFNYEAPALLKNYKKYIKLLKMKTLSKLNNSEHINCQNCEPK